jgi:hypothetical protein
MKLIIERFKLLVENGTNIIGDVVNNNNPMSTVVVARSNCAKSFLPSSVYQKQIRNGEKILEGIVTGTPQI